MNDDKTPISYNLDSAFRTGRANIRVFTATGGADSRLVPKNARRIALYVHTDGGDSCYVRNGVMTAANQGMIITTVGGPFKLHQRDNGDAATQEWHIWPKASDTVVTVIEVIGDCSCPTANP